MRGTLPAGGTFKGPLDITGFVVEDGVLLAEGLLTGTLRDQSGKTIGKVKNLPVSIPVTAISASQTCDVLHLELGPIDLELLGLIVHVDQIVIDIDADPAGGILGDLLCAIAGGFPGNLDLIAELLNDLLALLENL